MKVPALYVRPPWEPELRALELPDVPPAGEVLLRVDACGICGTDLTTAGRKAKDWQALGHEVAATILAVGSGAPHLSPQQTVVLESSSFCGRCELCRDGRVDLCRKAPHFWGRPAMGFSTHMLVPASCVVPYAGLDPAVACLAEPWGVAYDLVKTADIQMGERVCLVGPGPIGLAALALARHQAPARLVSVGRSSTARRQEIAARLGAETRTVDGPLDREKELAGAFDHVLLTAPTACIPPALSLLAYGGRLTYIGLAEGSGAITFDAENFHFRKLQLRASFASPAIYFPAVLRLLAAGILPGAELVSHRFPLRDAGDALVLCRERKPETLKVVIAG